MDQILKDLSNNAHKMQNIQVVNFGNNLITDVGFKQLIRNIEKLPKLRVLNFWGHKTITDNGFGELIKNVEKIPNL